MKLIAILILSLCTLSAGAQGLFGEKYHNCVKRDMCLYCGDTVAHFDGLSKHFEWQISHSPNGYEARNFTAYYEVSVDSAGHACVISVRNLGTATSWAMKDDILRWINEMPAWKPALKNGQPINSSVILKFKLYRSFFEMGFASLKETGAKQ